MVEPVERRTLPSLIIEETAWGTCVLLAEELDTLRPVPLLVEVEEEWEPVA